MSKRKMTALQLPVSAQPCWMSQGCSNLHFSTSAVRLVCLSSGKDQKISWCVLNSINSKAMEERMEMGEYRDAPCVQQELGRYTGDSLEGRWEEKMRWGRHSRNYPFLLFPDHYYCILNCLADVLRIWLIRVGKTHSPGQVFSFQVILSSTELKGSGEGIHNATAAGTQKTLTREGSTGRGKSKGLCAESSTAVFERKRRRKLLNCCAWTSSFQKTGLQIILSVKLLGKIKNKTADLSLSLSFEEKKSLEQF